jgi:hypothetical protein
MGFSLSQIGAPLRRTRQGTGKGPKRFDLDQFLRETCEARGVLL